MYASVEDVEKRCRRSLSESEKTTCEILLEDACILVDSYNKNAPDNRKKVVCCNVVIRALGNGQEDIPIGTTQGSMSALGYTQSWTFAGNSGELYLTKVDKKLLGAGDKIGMCSTLEGLSDV